jgi:cation diffusion facilitator family transporter
MMTEVERPGHSHQFNEANLAAEARTRWVVAITATMMVIEIIGGYVLNSMALLADGWHMSSHAVAMGISLLAYAYARKHANDTRFAFGTWKVEILGGFSSAMLLVMVAVLMLIQSGERFANPTPIFYNEAIAIAALGLVVNLVCAWLLSDDHSHHHHDGHTHGHDDHGHHDHAHGHHDVNLRSAYIHVVADAATSVLAIVALFGGKYFDAVWLDPVMGVVGAILVARWAIGLLRESGRILLDAEMHSPVVDEIRDVVREDLPGATITDLHVWRVGRGNYACILGLRSDTYVAPKKVRSYLSVHEELKHITVEIDGGFAN